MKDFIFGLILAVIAFEILSVMFFVLSDSKASYEEAVSYDEADPLSYQIADHYAMFEDTPPYLQRAALQALDDGFLTKGEYEQLSKIDDQIDDMEAEAKKNEIKKHYAK